MFFESNFNEQIARRATIGSWFAITCTTNSHSVINTCRNFDFKRFVILDFANTHTHITWVRNIFTSAFTGRASLLHREKPLAHLYLTVALASMTSSSLCARFSTTAMTVATLIPAWYSNLTVFTTCCFLKGNFHGIT